MKKRILTIFLVILLAVTSLTVCYADGIDDLLNVNLNNASSKAESNSITGESGTEEKIENFLTEVTQALSGIRKVIADIISFLPKVIAQALLLTVEVLIPTMDKIVFSYETDIGAELGEAVGAIAWGNLCRLTYFDTTAVGLAGEMRGFVSAFYQAFRYVALMGFIIAIACIAVKMILSSVGKQKNYYKESLKNWLVGLVLLVVGHWIMIYAIYFSDYLVRLIVKLKNSIFAGLAYEQNLTTVFGAAVGEAAGDFISLMIWPLMAIIAIIIFVAMNLKIFKIYLERVVVVGVLIMIFPLVTVLYAFEKAGVKKGSTFESWLRIFMDQVFIQPVHALTLTFVIIVLNALQSVEVTTIPIIGVVIVLMVLNMMFSIENIIKRVFAINGAGLGQPANVGAAGMAGAALAVGAGKNGLKNFKAGKEAVKGLGKDAKFFGKGGKLGTFLSAGNTATAYKAARANGRGKFGSVMSGIGGALTGGMGMAAVEQVIGGAGVHLPPGVLNSGRATSAEIQKAKKTVKAALKAGKFDANDRQALKTLKNSMDPEEFNNLMASGNINSEELGKFFRGEGDNLVGCALAAGMLGNVDDLKKLQTDGAFDEDKIKSLSMSSAERNTILRRFAKNPPTKPEKVKRPSRVKKPEEVKMPSFAAPPVRADYADDDEYEGALEFYNTEWNEYNTYQSELAKYNTYREDDKKYRSYLNDMRKYKEEMAPFQVAFEGMEIADPELYKHLTKEAGFDGQNASTILSGDDMQKRSAVRAVAACMANSKADLDSLKTGGNFDDYKIAHMFNSSMSQAETNDCLDVLQNAMFANGHFSADSGIQDAVEKMKIQYPERYAKGLEATGLTAHEFDNYVYGSDFGGNEFKAKSVIAGMIDETFRYHAGYNQDNFRRKFAVTPNTHSIANYGNASEIMEELADLETRLGSSGAIDQILQSKGIDFSSRAELENALNDPNSFETARTGFKQLINVIENGSPIVANEHKVR